jgi:hypothetical protein
MSLVLLVGPIFISHLTSFETHRVNLFQIPVEFYLNHFLHVSFLAFPNEHKYISDT